MRRQGKNLQIHIFKKRFKTLNPDADAANVDFYCYVVDTLIYEENLDLLERAYPQFIWRYDGEDASILVGLRECEENNRLKVTYELLNLHPCFGKLCGVTAQYSEECVTCELSKRCKAASKVLGYYGVFDCSFCGTLNTDIVRHLKIEYNYECFEAYVACENCQNTTKSFSFSGPEQGLKYCGSQDCVFYEIVSQKNQTSDGRYRNPYLFLEECSRCKPQMRLDCLDTILMNRKKI